MRCLHLLPSNVHESSIVVSSSNAVETDANVMRSLACTESQISSMVYNLEVKLGVESGAKRK